MCVCVCVVVSRVCAVGYLLFVDDRCILVNSFQTTLTPNPDWVALNTFS